MVERDDRGSVPVPWCTSFAPRAGYLLMNNMYIPRRTPTSNSALGKTVQKVTGQTTGKIGATFDSPSQTRPYPAGSQHILSLIIATSESEEEQLPELSSPAGLPQISGWANVTALDGQPPYLTFHLPFHKLPK